jgi:hypothetical protein
MYWNGGELDDYDCVCGRVYTGAHLTTVVMLDDSQVKDRGTTEGEK